MAEAMTDGIAAPGARRGRKFDQVVEGARQVFMADGFEGASVDDIARAAAVSKATLYSYFPDKRLMFIEVATRECGRQANMAADAIDMNAPARDVLTRAAAGMIDFVTSDFGRQMFRIAVAESQRFPALGRAFYDSGPQTIRRRLSDYFRLAMARGELEIADMALAADQFQMLVKADIFDRIVFNLAAGFSSAEKDRVITGAVETFLARYGRR
jgi:TetR/AcrR family transcriptional regulator, mexJK operon transcriptional repressor